MTRVRRLALASMMVVGSALAACGQADRPSLSVLAPWTDDSQLDANAAGEAAAFRKVLDAFERDHDVEVSYQGTRDVSQVLLSGIERGSPPDVAILPRLNDLMQYARRGAVLPLEEADHRDAQPAQLVPFDVGGGMKVYGVSITARVKSLIWYNPDVLSAGPPTTWGELERLVDTIAARRAVPWCMGMASPPLSGWPGTDWIEDLLLHQAGPDVYREWAAGRVSWTDPAVTNAWTRWNRIAPPGRRTGAALQTSFWDAGLSMFGHPPGCHLDHQASFVYASYRASWAQSGSAARVDFFPFPADERLPRTTGQLLEVSDNVAAVFNKRSPSARKLVNYLTSPRAQRIWREASDDPMFALRDDTDEDAYADEIGGKIARTLGSSTVCRDASDLMPADMTTAFQRAAMEYLEHPERLNELLAGLEKVRVRLTADDWLRLPCVHVGQG